MRIYLTGQQAVETPSGLANLRALPGRQGRHVFVCLVAQRTHPASYPELADAVWGTDPPHGWDLPFSVTLC